MDVAPSVDTVYQAIRTLHYDTEVHAKEKASIWLGEFQKSVFAWSISDALLREDRDLESSYFAAQTMRTKIQSSFHELPPESYEALRESLFSHFSTSGSATNHVIVIQLCLAVADLYLQVPAWKNCVVEIIDRFQKSSTDIGILLEILAFLTEELVHSRLRIGENRRSEIRNEFLPHATMLLSFLVVFRNICPNHTLYITNRNFFANLILNIALANY
ncbi:unnamed protein product [Soboliphyme baturini]|uniref:Xpo1 domain-containing protein n=1 Tax=Soboliphyme baturini TaxID=241478 RepID=A0A183I959_9BILA|nr:unnamed protein product [Soboliphyme baturini]